ncbi:hypothetical protein I6G96_15030 [Delftia acidovorans]|uniref:IgG-binding virulence factor TspB family protein n=1 Tax=Delftia acidovorans TaxID=80866 RepID=UPI0018D7D53C|nr:IgG-binding virulence factor TspB family protein [Delftia acidovorans]QPR32312.1 hypothetical protein I6G96_15030 [Delftia acidovorans]
MADLRALVIAIAASLAGVAHAGYAQLAPPVGWSPGAGLSSGAGGAFNFGNAANSAQLVNGTVRTNAALNVGGRAVSIPATMRFAANAPKIVAGILYLNPALRTIGLVAGWLGAAALVYDVADGLWKKNDPSFPVSDGFEYGRDYEGAVIREPNLELACDKLGPLLFRVVTGGGATDWVLKSTYVQGATCGISMHNPREGSWTGYGIDIYQYPGKCPAGSYSTPAGCVMQPPSRTVDDEEFKRTLDGQPMPQKLPEVFPHSLPVDLPEIQPMFIPSGNPVANPSYDPSQPLSPSNQPWNQPGVRVVPAPTPGSPWQVDLQPVDRPVTSPNPDPDPKPDPGDKPDDKPKEKDPGLCDMYPDIVACQKLGNIDAKELPKKTVSLSIDKQNIGPENGTCPAPRQFEIMGKPMAFQWDLLCDFANGIRPLLIGFAWLSAALAFIGLTRRGD